MLDRTFSLIAYLLLLAFLATLIIYVPRVDLGVVLLLSALLCGYDLLFHRPPGAK